MRRVWAGVLFAVCALGCGREAGDEPVQRVDVDDATRADAPVDAARDVGHEIDASCVDDLVAETGSSGWLRDACLWERVPELAICDVWQARLPSTRYPSHVVTSCGDGCRRLDVAPRNDVFGVSVGWSDGETSYVRLEYGSNDLGLVREYYDVTHDAVVASFETRIVSFVDTFSGMEFAQCAGPVMTIGAYAVEQWDFERDEERGGGPIDSYVARVRYRESTRVEPLGMTKTTLYGSAIGVGDRFAWRSGGGIVVGQGPPLTLTPVAAPTPGSFALETNGTDFVWSSMDADVTHPSYVEAWSSVDGLRTLATRSRKIFASSADADGVAWIESDASGPTGGTWTISDATLVRLDGGGSPRTIAAGLGDAGEAMVSGGGLAAARVCSTASSITTCELVVVRFADGKTWRFGSGVAGLLWQSPSSIDAHILVVGAGPFMGVPNMARRLYVLDVSQLDTLVTTLGSTADAGVP